MLLCVTNIDVSDGVYLYDLCYSLILSITTILLTCDIISKQHLSLAYLTTLPILHVAS